MKEGKKAKILTPTWAGRLSLHRKRPSKELAPPPGWAWGLQTWSTELEGPARRKGAGPVSGGGGEG